MYNLRQRSCLLITLHYIDQISVRMPAFVLSSLTCHRFVITSICVSSKCLCDVFHSNSVYAKVGGIPVTELNVLEREFLRMIDWNLTVSLLVLPSTHPTSHSPSTPVLGNLTTRLNPAPLLVQNPGGSSHTRLCCACECGRTFLRALSAPAKPSRNTT